MRADLEPDQFDPEDKFWGTFPFPTLPHVQLLVLSTFQFPEDPALCRRRWTPRCASEVNVYHDRLLTHHHRPRLVALELYSVRPSDSPLWALGEHRICGRPTLR